MSAPSTVSVQAVPDSMICGLAVFDPGQILLLANPRLIGLLGLPPDRMVAGITLDAVLDLLAGDATSTGPNAASRKAATRPASAYRFRTSNGRSVDVVFDPLPDGGLVMFVNSGAPMTAIEEQARRRATLLDLVLLNVPHGICVYGPDRRVTMFNDTYLKVMQGVPLQIGDSLDDVIRRRAAAGEYGEDDPEGFYTVQMSFKTARPQMRRRIRPNGTAIEVRTAPLPDGGHISVVTDITALVQAENALRRRAEQMATMLGHIRHGIMLWGPDRHLVASNPVAAELLDLPPDLLTPGRAEADVIAVLSQLGLFNEGARDGDVARMLANLDRSQPFEREIVTQSRRVLHAQSNPAPGGGWISTFTDITRMRETEDELRRAKDRAEAANRAKSRFLATMSHELLTPLNAIIGFSDALGRERGDVPAELVAEYNGQINDAGKRLLSLIQIVLDVARIESGRFEPDAEVVDIAKAIQIAARQLDSAAGAGEVAIELRIEGALPWVRGDERRLTQAISHLLSNAVKFTPAGGAVTVKAGMTPDGDLLVSVADTGIGIAGDELERVFEPFTQVDASLSRRYQGAGLGLFTARAVVTAHGGTLQLTSRPEEGTLALITLPKARLIQAPNP